MFIIVPQGSCVVIERLGKFERVAEAGFNLKIPILESFRRVRGWGPIANSNYGLFISLTEQQIDTMPRDCYTKDNVKLTTNASIYWRINDVKKCIYEVSDLPTSLSDIALNALRANLGTMSLDQVLAERSDLNAQLSAQLSETCNKWGVTLIRVEIQELKTDDDVANSMLKEMTAEREKRAIISKSEGETNALLRMANAKRDAAIIEAEGKAQALKMVADAENYYLSTLEEKLSKEDLYKIIIAEKYLESIKSITNSPANKVFIPSDFNGLIDAK